MKKMHMRTSFAKLTMSFLLLGVLPLLVLSILFFVRYANSIQSVTVTNYRQIDSFIGKNVGSIIESADVAMGSVYDYGMEEKGDLTDILLDKNISGTEQSVYIHQVLEHVMEQSEYITSVRMVTENGDVYGVFSGQGKTLRSQSEEFTRFSPFEEENLRTLLMLPAVEETKYCVNSDDYVFDLVRNVMDTSSVETVYHHPLATMYVGINVETIHEIIEGIKLNQNAEVYVYDAEFAGYIYSSGAEHYAEAPSEPFLYADKLQGESGDVQIDGKWMFYQQIDDSSQYAILLVDQAMVRSLLFQNQVFFILVLAFSCFTLLAFYMMFSRRMSEPHVKLKTAMEQLQEGNMDARVEVVKTGDEMEYLCEGFNQMAEDLQHNIEKVLIAQIYAREAELDALKMQIQPHYLYNTLDVIRMTALEQEDELTAELLEALAAQLHYVIGHHDDRVTIRQELDMLRTYFVITKVRYENRFGLTIHVADEDQDLYILKMMLQPMVENAIKHGLREKEGAGMVSVNVVRKGDVLEIVVMDDGVGMEPEQVERIRDILQSKEIGYLDETGWVSVGMKNVYDRIRINCGKQYGYEITSIKGAGTIVTFRLPVWEGSETHVSGDHSG